LWKRYMCLQYAIIQKAAGSIPDDVIWFFNSSNPPSRTMALGSAQFLTEMCTRNLARGKERTASTSQNPVGLHGLLQG
jgi:hypothetical protein